ncbi:hypothetical protein SCA6_018070 [Theobroma cacao]
MEKAFGAIRSSDQDNVKFTAYLLQRRVANTYENDFEFFNWGNCRAFYAKYFPRSKLLQLEREFLNLVQGSMAVDDYETEFNRLSKFFTSLVSDDESRVRRFKNGLNAHIHRGLAPLHLISYNEVVGRAKSLDFVWRETQEAMRDFQKKRILPNFKPLKKSQASVTFNDRLPPHAAQSYHGKTSQQRPRCSFCCRGHQSSECIHVTGACFRYGQ